jgi:hypothetical protein
MGLVVDAAAKPEASSCSGKVMIDGQQAAGARRCA